MIIRFDDYGPPLSTIDVGSCLLDAANNVIAHWGDFGPIGPTVLVTISGTAKLHLVATDDIYWNQWGTAIRGITHFLKTYEPVCLDFSIRIPQKGVVAGGSLSLVAASNHT